MKYLNMYLLIAMRDVDDTLDEKGLNSKLIQLTDESLMPENEYERDELDEQLRLMFENLADKNE